MYGSRTVKIHCMNKTKRKLNDVNKISVSHIGQLAATNKYLKYFLFIYSFCNALIQVLEFMRISLLSQINVHDTFSKSAHYYREKPSLTTLF